MSLANSVPNAFGPNPVLTKLTRSPDWLAGLRIKGIAGHNARAPASYDRMHAKHRSTFREKVVAFPRIAPCFPFGPILRVNFVSGGEGELGSWRSTIGFVFHRGYELTNRLL